MSYGREASEHAPEPDGEGSGPLARLRRHLVEWPDRCVETQVAALRGEE
jgi:hypothetical protein